MRAIPGQRHFDSRATLLIKETSMSRLLTTLHHHTVRLTAAVFTAFSLSLPRSLGNRGLTETLFDALSCASLQVYLLGGGGRGPSAVPRVPCRRAPTLRARGAAMGRACDVPACGARQQHLRALSVHHCNQHSQPAYITNQSTDSPNAAQGSSTYFNTCPHGVHSFSPCCMVFLELITQKTYSPRVCLFTSSCNACQRK